MAVPQFLREPRRDKQKTVEERSQSRSGTAGKLHTETPDSPSEPPYSSAQLHSSKSRADPTPVSRTRRSSRRKRRRRKRRRSPVDILVNAIEPSLRSSAGARAKTRDPVEIIAEALEPGIARDTASPELSPDGTDVLSHAIDVVFEALEVPPQEAPSPIPASRRKQGPGEPFWNIWLEHQEYLRKHSMRLISGNIADAEDALSKAMLIAAQKFALYEDQIVNERAWLTCLVHNVCMDHYRSLKRQKGWMAEASIDNSDGMPLACTPSWPSPEDAVAMEESIQALVNVLVSLPDSLRQPLIMRVLQDMPYPEIAERLNITQPAVRKRVQLARERLRKHWSL